MKYFDCDDGCVWLCCRYRGRLQLRCYTRLLRLTDLKTGNLYYSHAHMASREDERNNCDFLCFAGESVQRALPTLFLFIPFECIPLCEGWFTGLAKRAVSEWAFVLHYIWWKLAAQEFLNPERPTFAAQHALLWSLTLCPINISDLVSGYMAPSTSFISLDIPAPKTFLVRAFTSLTSYAHVLATPVLAIH